MSQEIAQHSLKHGASFPCDAGSDFWEDLTPTPPPAKDWAHAAARGVLADLLDRRGIKWELEKVDSDVRAELTQSMADIIRLAAAAEQAPQPTTPEPEPVNQMLLNTILDETRNLGRAIFKDSCNHSNDAIEFFHAEMGVRLRAAIAAVEAHTGEQTKVPLTDEQDRALCEANCNAEADAYFAARPALDFPEMRRIFYAGHRRAWISKDPLTNDAHGIGITGEAG